MEQNKTKSNENRALQNLGSPLFLGRELESQRGSDRDWEAPKTTFLQEMRSHLIEKYGRAAYKSEEEFQFLALKEWSEMVDENTRMKAEYERLFEVLESDPRLAVFFSEMMKGTPVRVALVQADIFDFAPQKEEPDFDNYQTALKEHKAKKQEHENRLKEHAKNCECSTHTIQKFYDEKELDDAEIEAFAAYVEKMYNNIVQNKLDAETLERLWCGYTLDSRLEEAKQAGFVEGKNNQITKQHSMRNYTDGMPSSGAGAIEERPKRGYIERILNGEYI